MFCEGMIKIQLILQKKRKCPKLFDVNKEMISPNRGRKKGYALEWHCPSYLHGTA